MYPNNFFMPPSNYGFAPSAFSLGGARNTGLFSFFKKINFGSILNGANKTLNVVNQTIPLIRQAGPMIDNMKSMVKLASVFKDETDTKPKKKNVINNTQNFSDNNNNSVNNSYNSITNSSNPNFFI